MEGVNNGDLGIRHMRTLNFLQFFFKPKKTSKIKIFQKYMEGRMDPAYTKRSARRVGVEAEKCTISDLLQPLFKSRQTWRLEEF